MRYWVIEAYMRQGFDECGRFLREIAACARAGMLRTWAFGVMIFTAGIVVQLALLAGLAEIVLKELANDLRGGEKLYIWLRKR